MSRPEALAEMAKLVQPLNVQAGEPIPRVWTVGDWIRDTFLPLSRRKWKLSTASTTGDRIRKHIVTDLGSLEIQSITRGLLQQYLERKAAKGLSFSLVDHLRWDLRAIFRLAAQDRVLTINPADTWVFPSGTTDTPLGRDNAWKRLIAPRLKTIGLEWATFQIMRRTHASLSRQAGIDPKLVADQLGHGLGVSLAVYTVATLDKRQEAVEVLEASLASS